MLPGAHLEGAAAPGETCSQDVGVGNDDERQQDSQRQQPDEGPPPAVAAVAVVTGRADQRDEEEAEHRTDTCGQRSEVMKALNCTQTAKETKTDRK